MVNPAPPSSNPANTGNLAAAVAFAIRKSLQDTDDMLPAKILTYDRDTNRAKVQIMVPYVTTGNEVLQRAIVASVPVFQMGSGGFVISFPVKPGDLGWIKACDRDISMFKKTYNNASGPPTQRLHQFSDAMFFADTMLQQVTITAEDEDNLVIQNYAGTVKIAFWSTFIKLISRLGIGTVPDPNVILDVQSTTKAFRMPRMTTAQRDAIPNPQEGMLIWNVDTHGINSYNSATEMWG